MNPLTLEWVEKANGDLRTARREYRARNAPNYDAVCFHAQQAAEKYLRAVLQEPGQAIPRVHSLAELLALLLTLDTSFLLVQDSLLVMEGYSVHLRYPGFSSEKQEAKEAYPAAVRVSKFVKEKLGIKDHV